MDNPATPRPIVVLRFSLMLWLPTIAVVRRVVAALLRPRPLPAFPRPSAATLRRIAAVTANVAIVLILIYTILLMTAAIGYGLQAMDRGLWDLARLVQGHRPDVDAPALSLVVASIVVLSVISAHPGRHHDHW